MHVHAAHVCRDIRITTAQERHVITVIWINQMIWKLERTNVNLVATPLAKDRRRPPLRFVLLSQRNCNTRNTAIYYVYK